MTNEHSAYAIPNREMRAFPKGWQHPKDTNGKHIALLPYGYAGDENDGPVATPNTTMPPTPLRGETEIAAYETVSEGTPISPAFPDTPEGRLALVRHCAEHCTTFADHRADAEAWAAILFGDAAVGLDGRVVAEG
jgi:hypothetical protein